MRRYGLVLAAALFAVEISAGPIPRKYGVQTTVLFQLFEPDGINFATGEVCEQDAGTVNDDVLISKDGGAFADTANCFTEVGQGWYSIVLSAAEMQACNVALSVIDDATKQWLDIGPLVETYGHASACHELDLDGHPFALSAKDVVASGTVDSASFTPTATQFESTDSSVIDTPAGADLLPDTYVGRVACFTSGALSRNCYTITDYELPTSARGKFTIAGAQQAPADNDEFVIQ